MGMKVVAADPFVTESHLAGCEIATLGEVLATADVLSLHAPATPDTTRLIDADTLAMMKPGSYLVNCARGALVDHDALFDAIESGRLAGAGLDVTDPEPLPAGHRLLNRPDVVVTPHIASSTVAGRRRLYEHAIENALAVLDGRPATTRISENPDSGQNAVAAHLWTKRAIISTMFLRRPSIASGSVMSRLKISAKVWRLATLKKHRALIDMCSSTASSPRRNTPAFTPRSYTALTAWMTGMLSCWMRLGLRQELAVVDVLRHHEADEIGVCELVIEGEADQLAQRRLGLQVVEVERGLDAADAPVGFFEHGHVQAFLAREVVIDHALAGVRERGDLVDARAAQALVGELLGRHFDDVGHRALRVVGARGGGRRAAGAALCLYWFVHGAERTAALRHNATHAAPPAPAP